MSKKSYALKITLTLLTVMTLFSSCKEEEILTDGEKIGRQLQQLADRENVLFVSIPPFVNRERFSIEGQFLIVRGASSQYYNLNQLIRTWVPQELDENDRRINYFELTFQD